nr:DNA methyltransferase [Candidatus Njordarchaeum guaymaensis]
MREEEENDSPPKICCICKLKHDIRVESKVDLARREIEESLGTTAKTIVTLPALFKKPPFSQLDDIVIDRVTRLLYLGKAHGFLAEAEDLSKLVRLMRTATYLREIYGIMLTQEEKVPEIVKAIGLHDVKAGVSPLGKFIDVSPNIQFYNQKLGDGSLLTTVFLIPAQTLLEYAAEVVKLPYVTFTRQFTNLDEKLDRMEAGVKKGIEELRQHLTHDFKRMPWLGLFKERIGDYVDWAFSDFRTWGLHFVHKHEGKADPWLARSALNLLGVSENDTVLDPFCGSGTFIADAPLLDINAIGMDINPLSTMITKVKCGLADIPLPELRESLIKIQKKSSASSQPKGKLRSVLAELGKNDKQKLLGNEDAFLEILSTKDAIDGVSDSEPIRDFLYVILSRSITEIGVKQQKRKLNASGNFMKDAITFYLQTYASQEILHALKIEAKGRCKVLTSDARNSKAILDGKVDGIVTSPPYFDAVDYVGSSTLPIRILGIDGDNKHLESQTIGSRSRITGDTDRFLCDMLPESCRLLVEGLMRFGRERKARIVLQYLTDITDCLHRFQEVINEKRRMIFVVGKYHNWKLGNNNVLIDGAQVLIDIGEHVGLPLEYELSHSISKIEAGKRIREESVIVWRKDENIRSKRDASRSKNILKIVS